MHSSNVLSIARYIVLCVAVLSFSFSAQAQGPLESVLEVFLVEQVSTGNGVEEKLVPVDQAEPGSTLEYVLTYKNISDQNLKGFVIKNPIPANTSYIGSSALSPKGAVFNVSIDYGSTYETAPVIRIVKDENGKDKEIVIPPDQYNSLRWVMQDSLGEGDVMSMRYRVIID